jgi:hypothetical protein
MRRGMSVSTILKLKSSRDEFLSNCNIITCMVDRSKDLWKICL